MNSNNKVQNDIEKIFLDNRSTVFRKPKNNEGAVVIVSGGLDSTTGLFRLLEEFECEFYPLYIDRGARAGKKEIESVKYYLKIFNNKYNNINPLEIVKAEVPPASFKSHASAEQLVSLGHTLRNSNLQTIGIQYAASLCSKLGKNIKTVFTFNSPDDNFPHSQLVALRAQNLMTCIHLGDWEWQVTSPLLEESLWGRISKSDSIIYAMKNGLKLDKTYTCISNDEVACGTCDACEARLKAFKSINIKDPLKYKVLKDAS